MAVLEEGRLGMERALVARRSSLVARRSSLVARRSSLVARRSSLVARRSRWCVALAAFVTAGWALGEPDARADLSTNSQLAVTQSDVPGTLWTVWSRSIAGTLVGRREEVVGGVRWIDRGLPAVGVQCSIRGVAATSYVANGHIYERIYCAGGQANGSIYEYTFDNGVGQGWSNLNIPGAIGTKREIVASSIVIAGHWWAFVFFTTGADDLYVWSRDVTAGTPGNLSQIDAANSYSIASQLAVSRAPGAVPAYLHLFAAKADGTIQVWRRDAGLSAPWNIGRPEAGKNAMGTAVAVEEQINGTDYRVLLFCTSTVANNKLYVAWADSAVAGDNFTWLNPPPTLPAGSGNFMNSGYALAATSRSDGVNRAVDAVALASLVYAPQHIWRVRYAGTGFAADNPFDIGLDGETGSRTGGLAAYPRTGRSVVAFHGSDADRTPPRLYTKDGTDSEPADAWNWANHGDGEPTSTLTAGPLGETSGASFDGRAIVAGINHPISATNTDFGRVKTLWSSTDGDTWAAQWVDPASGYPAPPWMTTDPTVDFDENGTAYLSLEAVNLNQTCDLDESGTDWAILLYTSVDGSFPNPPTRIDEAPGHLLDHPFMAVYRDPGGNDDRLHIAWFDDDTDEVLYSSMPIGGAIDGPYVLHQGLNETLAPYLTVGAGGVAYVNWGSRYCRIADDFHGCAHVVQQFDADHQAVGLAALNDGSGRRLASGSSAFVASPSDPDVVYWVFQRPESQPHTGIDLYSSTGQYWEGQNPPFDWTPPVLVGEYQNDDADQFAPGIAVSQYTSFMMPLVSVMWHERHGGNCHSTANRCFKVRRSVSYSNGVAYHYPQTIPIDAVDSWSDPGELPLSCLRGQRFLGHYRTVRGDLLHTRHIVTGSPDGGASLNEAVLRSGWNSGGYYYW